MDKEIFSLSIFYYIWNMEMQIFIPELKKNYTLQNDVEILLYPLGNGLNYKTSNLEHSRLYGSFKKKEFIINYKREILEYKPEMESDWRQRKFNCFFLISDNLSQHNKIEKSLEYINYPDAALALTDAKVYVEKAFWINWENKMYNVFTRKGKYDKYLEYFNLEKKVFSDLNQIIEKLNLQVKEYIKYYNDIYSEALKNGSDFSQVIQGNVPIKYEIKKGSKIKLIKLSYKDNRNFKTKIPFSLIEVNNEELILKTEELSRFILS